MDKHELQQNQVPRAAQETAKDANKENASALGEPRTPPRKVPTRDKLKPLMMPKALKI